MRWLVCMALLACGGSSEEDEVLERELEAEEGSSGSEELAISDRHRAAETRVFEACYDELAHLDEGHRERRELRLRLLTESEVNPELGARVAVERESENAGAQTEELPSNVDDPASGYSADEREIIRLENELDVFHGEHPHHDQWTDADLDAYESIANRLIERCHAMRSR